MKYIRMWDQKNSSWIWIAVDRLGKRFISYVCGDRSRQTGLKLWDRVKDIGKLYCSDYWKSYEQFILKDKHRQSKFDQTLFNKI